MGDSIRRDQAATVAMYLGWREKAIFMEHIRLGARVGQAFMNMLRSTDADSYFRLTNSTYDPFYKDDASSVLEALDFITRVR